MRKNVVDVELKTKQNKYVIDTTCQFPNCLSCLCFVVPGGVAGAGGRGGCHVAGKAPAESAKAAGGGCSMPGPGRAHCRAGGIGPAGTPLSATSGPQRGSGRLHAARGAPSGQWAGKTPCR